MPYGRLLDSAQVHLDDEIANRYAEMRHAFAAGDLRLAKWHYRQLRTLHSVELYYEVDLKLPIRFVHPLGTVLGRAEYAPHLVVYQGVSVGSTVDHERPKFTGPCVMFPHSAVIGPVTVGNNVWITAGCIVEARPGKRVIVPDNVVVRAAGPSQDGMRQGVVCTPTRRSVIDTFFPPHLLTAERER